MKGTYLWLLLSSTTQLLCCLQYGLCMLWHALLSVVFSPCLTVVRLSSLRIDCYTAHSSTLNSYIKQEVKVIWQKAALPWAQIMQTLTTRKSLILMVSNLLNRRISRALPLWRHYHLLTCVELWNSSFQIAFSRKCMCKRTTPILLLKLNNVCRYACYPYI